MTKVKVSERAILARLNRFLAKDGRVVKKCKADSRGHSDLGDFYEVDTRANLVTAKDLDPEALARECGVLRAYEVVGDVETSAEHQATAVDLLTRLSEGELTPAEVNIGTSDLRNRLRKVTKELDTEKAAGKPSKAAAAYFRDHEK